MQIKNRFQAVMFDVDGTLTELGGREIPDFLQLKLREVLDSGIPLAICSGRHHPNVIVNRIENLDPHKWVLCAENGACGYHFDDNDWQEFYREPWPDSEIAKNEFVDYIENNFEFTKLFNEESSVIIRPGKSLDLPLAELGRLCNSYQETIVDWLTENSIKNLHVNNSHIGVIVNPTHGDKDRGIFEFAKLLGISDTKKILCIGDQPGPGCNDEAFLSGRYGTPYSVGTQKAKANHVYDKSGATLIGPEGTFEILERFVI